ncbi:MAG: 2-C-methyl-D-erythritol 4-phosphate cytidylyltransferase [Actinomycetota bacterium]
MTSQGADVWTIVVAAGSGRRFGADKLSVAIDGDRTVLDVSVETALQASSGVVVVLRADDPLLHAPPAEGLTFVAGGDSRSESARNGLAVVPETADVILIHDAARPLAGLDVYERVISAVRGGAAAVVPAVPVVDTIRTTEGDVVDRDRLRAVQTPQGFAAGPLREAHARGGDATDDAALVAALGHDVVVVDGDLRSLKVTRPVDIAFVRALLEDPEA